MRAQLAAARDAGVDTVLIAPMIVGLSNFHRLVREHPAVAFIAHPSMAGAARIAPAFLLGRLFRLLGAEQIGLSLSGGHAVEPEQSTVAIVAHHPQAVYFGMKSGFIPKDKAPDELIKGTEKDPSRAAAAL